MDVSGVASSVGPAGRISAGFPKTSTGEGGQSFAGAVADALLDVNAQQLGAQHQVTQLAAGEIDNLHEVVLGVAKADLAFQLVLEIRNQLIHSYQELMRMQV